MRPSMPGEGPVVSELDVEWMVGLALVIVAFVIFYTVMWLWEGARRTGRSTLTQRCGYAGGCVPSTTQATKGRDLSHLYGHFGLVRLSRLGHAVSWTKA